MGTAVDTFLALILLALRVSLISSDRVKESTISPSSYTPSGISAETFFSSLYCCPFLAILRNVYFLSINFNSDTVALFGEYISYIFQHTPLPSSISKFAPHVSYRDRVLRSIYIPLEH